MSFTSTTTNSGVGSSTELRLKEKSPKKPLKKMNFKNQGKIIRAFEKGQAPAQIANNLGLNPHVVANVCKQKYSVLDEYKTKSARNEFYIDLKQSLLSWFELQISNEITVTEEQMRVKADEIADSLNNKKFKCTDVWLLDFRITNNIIAYRSTSGTDQNSRHLLDWLKENENKFDRTNVYIGGTCGLWHSLDLDQFVSSTNEQNQVSLLLISNISGSDKQQLTIVGKEVCPLESEIKSLPVIYYQCMEPFFNYNLLQNIIQMWDNKLKSEKKYILLFLDINEHFTNGLQLENIKLVCSSQLQFIPSVFRRIGNCFKYHYRRLQLMQTFRYSKAISQQQFLEYLNLMSLAWHCVTSQAIHSIFCPPVNGCLYFNNILKDQMENEENDKCSLLQWCKMYDIPIKVEDNSILDKYVYCDEALESMCADFRDIVIPYTPNVLEMLAGVTEPKAPTAIDVFQAMKKLVRYLQSETAASTSVEAAKTLEDNFEYDALSEIQQRIENDNIIENTE